MIEIPDTLQYRAALMGQLEWLADWRCWEHYQEDYADPPADNLLAAQLFAIAVTEAEFHCMDCDDVADCIDESENVQSSLDQWFSNAVDNSTTVQQALERAFDPAQGGQEIPQEYAYKNQYGNALSCDPNDGWGHIRDGLVKRSFDRVIQVLQQIEFTTNNQEMLSQALNAMPGIGAVFDVVPVTDWFLWFDNVRNWMKEGFEAGDSEDLRDEIACELFCIWQENCTLSLEQVRQYYWDKATALIPSWDDPFASFQQLMEALANPTEFSGAAAVYGLMAAQYGFTSYINDWFGIKVVAMSNDLALGDPSDDWETLCECIEEWETILDLSTSDYGFVSNGDFTSGNGGTWVDTEGLISAFGVASGNGFQMVQMKIDIDETTLTHVDIEYEITNGTQGSGTVPLAIGTQVDTLQFSTTPPPDGFNNYQWNGTQAGVTTLAFRVQSGYNPGVAADPGGTVKVTSIAVRGTGTKPSQFP